MKKLMIAAAALCMSASAMAEWVVVEQNEKGAVMQENALGVSFAVQQVAASGTAPIADIATEYAKKNNCAAPTAGTMSGFPVQHVVCPDATQVSSCWQMRKRRTVRCNRFTGCYFNC